MFVLLFVDFTRNCSFLGEEEVSFWQCLSPVSGDPQTDQTDSGRSCTVQTWQCGCFPAG